MKTISLANDKGKVIVDDEDYEWASVFSWRDNRGYAQTSIRHGSKVKSYNMHTIINCTPKGRHTDHKNRNGLDNRRSNLRTATPSENRANVRIPNKGISKVKSTGKWVARIKTHGVHIHIGTFSNAKEASSAYKIVAKELFGEFAA